MTEQQLVGAQISARLEQVDGEGVAERMCVFICGGGFGSGRLTSAMRAPLIVFDCGLVVEVASRPPTCSRKATTMNAKGRVGHKSKFEAAKQV